MVLCALGQQSAQRDDVELTQLKADDWLISCNNEGLRGIDGTEKNLIETGDKHTADHCSAWY